MDLYGNANFPKNQGLYSSSQEHESCGVAFIANIKGQKSHEIVHDSLKMLSNLEHRGAAGADENTGDGAGILLEIPDDFFRSNVDFKLPPPMSYACANIFFPKSKETILSIQTKLKLLIDEFNLEFLGWREVPVCSEYIGIESKRCEPITLQLFIGKGDIPLNEFSFTLYRLRKKTEKYVFESGLNESKDFYICSMSHESIVYKGMFLSHQLGKYYKDLTDEKVKSAFAIVHQRFSTNTFPAWKLAHPYRICAHNGEFNTINGNKNMMKVRETHLSHPSLSDEDLENLKPIIYPGLSDSACFDSAVEFFCQTNRSLPHVLAMMIPEAWKSRVHMHSIRRSFYQYHAHLMEPWDGPATIAAFNNQKIVAILDRNGLRPARYCLTKDNRIIFGSEAGMLPIKDEDILFKGRLWPGKMICVDLANGSFMDDDEAKQTFLTKMPYGSWLKQYMKKISDLPEPIKPPKYLKHPLQTYQRAFNYTIEELEEQLVPMMLDGQEAVGSMGNDAPLAIFSRKPKLLFDYFRQRFAQVTNPAIDPIREEIVMGMSTYFGTPWNAFQESWEFCRQVELTSPILNNYELEKFAQTKNLYVRGVIIPILFEINSGPHCLKIALQNICKKAEEKIHLGYNTLILSDRNISENFAAIPIVLATACVHFHLIKKGKRGGIGIILETGQARLVHHMAVLIGYGANGINPYLAFESIRNLRSRDILPPKDGNEDDYEDPCAFYERNYQKALKKGLFKIMSKMGISTLASYQGAHIFEIIGLSENVANQYFNGTDSPLGGIEIEEIKEDVLCFHKLAFSTTVPGNLKIEYGGELKWTPHGENHINDPTSIALLQQAVRENSYEKFKKYSTQINQHNQTPFLVRRFLKLTNKQKSISIDQVEPVSEIVKRFVTGAMSLGALSPEAHENLAIAMNKIQGKSNSGEGGEDPRRYKKNKNGEIRRSAIKQIASGRFGVTTEYLLNANELQIKIAQGAKPGEGGQLPGHKVNPYIAKLRHSIPGVSLISPPPHHDIYSIEDLAQLIFDLKNVNPEAKVSVKLVSEWGVGTIAAGVAKAHAETIIIAGHDGGTGASPISSVKQSGIPWELGLAQTQQTLCLNNLRQRVKLQVDGQLKTGLDIIVAAILGADEYGFATMPLIAQGCVMMRKCHLDTCPVGIATQNDELRKKFTGKPEHIVHLMQFLAEEVREYLSYLGFENIQEIIGRTDLLNFNNQLPQGRYSTLNWQRILHKVDTQGSDAFVTSKQEKTTSVCIDDHIIEEISKSDVQDKFTINLHISTQNRAVGSKLSGWLYKNREIYSQKIIEANFKGSSGQSFGAFLYHGLRLNLEGESNDYLGKGMSGGMITLFPPREASYFSKENWIAGNALLYGATGGEVYIAGRAGERFAVRNSGCTAVIEGVGDHACEYMTGGKVVVLGHTGRNFAAGMSGGIAYILDEERLFSRRCNPGMVDIEQTREEDYPDLLKLIQNHYNYTESLTAKDVMDRWEEIKGLFIKIIPREYKKYIISTYQVDTRRMNHGLR